MARMVQVDMIAEDGIEAATKEAWDSGVVLSLVSADGPAGVPIVNLSGSDADVATLLDRWHYGDGEYEELPQH